MTMTERTITPAPRRDWEYAQKHGYSNAEYALIAPGEITRVYIDANDHLGLDARSFNLNSFTEIQAIAALNLLGARGNINQLKRLLNEYEDNQLLPINRSNKENLLRILGKSKS